jgi:predicted nucleic acid-binding protein
VKSFLLDTNVISEPVRPQPAAAVLRWLETRDPESLYLSVITLGEIVAGIRRLAASARRRTLERWLMDVLAPQFHDRILSFDAEAAWRWGAYVADSASAGRTLPAVDLQIAAIASQRKLVLVTRNAAEFAGLDLVVVNPWKVTG